MHLFAYGTLMCDDIMEAVSGQRLIAVVATLCGFRRLCVKGEPYPAIVPDATSCVQGVVYRDVSPLGWDRLDRFEGDMYTRERVQIELTEGVRMEAETYVIHGDFIGCLDGVEWDFEAFLRAGKERFCTSYTGYQSLI